MREVPRRRYVLAAIASFLVACSPNSRSGPAVLPSAYQSSNVRESCGGPVTPGHVRCFALIRTDLGSGRRYSLMELPPPDALPSPASIPTPTPPPPPTWGFGPAEIHAAYGLGSSIYGSSPIVAIVDAYDDPTAEIDLATYRSEYGLPPCTTANGCFIKLNEFGYASRDGLPSADEDWSGEIALDLEMVSAICPNCRIILVEATTTSLGDVTTAVSTAAASGAQVISNSYGGPEFSSQTFLDSYYNIPGVVVTVSSGDDGYSAGAQYPASSPYVVAVGGTSLRRASNARGWTETAWSSAGSGCSAYESKPIWQVDANCAKRTVADVSAVADPNTPVAVYRTPIGSSPGWFAFGGTSAAAPIVAGIYALALRTGVPNAAQSLYQHPGSLFDVTAGANGYCSFSYLCTGGPGYDGPTGLGSPNGTEAF